MQQFVGFPVVGQVREGWIADQVTAGVQRAPREQRHGVALLDERHDVAQVGGGSLVVDVELAPFERKSPGATPAHPEDWPDVEAHELEAEHRDQVQRRGTLAAVE